MIPELARRLLLDAGIAILVVAALDALRKPTSEERRHGWVRRAFMWLLAPVVERWHGLSLVRLIAVWTAVATVDIAHDWIHAAEIAKVSLGWPFTVLVIGGLFLSVVMALGAKYIDKTITLLTVVLAAKFNVKLPSPDKDSEEEPRAATKGRPEL